jgi:hypothetical protein
MKAVAADLVASADIGTNPRVDLHCGLYVHPDGDLAVPVALAGIPQAEICEHSTRYLIGEPRNIASCPLYQFTRRASA